jgi:hypothetical protein
MSWFVGLDVGQQHDYTALAMIEQTGAHPAYRYDVRHLQRFPLKLDYVAVCEQVCTLLQQMQARHSATLIVDATGVGKPLVDWLTTLGLSPKAVMVTSGAQVSQDGSLYHVPKVELVTTLQLLLGSGRLRIAEELPEAPTLIKELVGYRRKITAALHTIFGAWREGQHDDLLFAAGLAVWYAEFHGQPAIDISPGDMRQIWADAGIESGPPDAPLGHRRWNDRRRYW